MAKRDHSENHFVGRVGWLRAAVLGANDGLLSTSSLIIGVASASTGRSGVIIAGIAGLIAGAMSMAAGEYVSVSSQRDAENADLAREAEELRISPMAEQLELSAIYIKRGLDANLAREVAQQLMAHDALGAHARDELGLSEDTAAKPVQAALASAASFAVGAAPPLVIAVFVTQPLVVWSIAATSLAALAILGALGAKAGGAPLRVAVIRVVFWGALAMTVTASIGRLFSTVV
ncbi:VIT1/CCC1 transporter family protein [Sphingomonas sp. GB1N7]|uniref:VIT1/CCC1 transporter family protein n=1 Tax=Parasphingomonas caseinilytica TaxID=3096158 RepID=UPI002FCC127D